MAKKTIKLNESKLRKLVKESINEIGFEKNRRFATTTVTDPVGYHYASREAAANIVKNGFSPRYIGKNGQILGPGIYFYTEPHVYDRYGDIEIKAKITGTYPATEWDSGTLFVVPIEDLDKIEIISAKEKHGYGPEHKVKDGKKEHEINQMYRQYGNRSVGGINGVDDADDYYDLNKNSGSLAMQAMEEPDDYASSLYRDNGQNPRWASPKGDFSTKRISESQLRKMIAEAVNELDWKTYQNAAAKTYGKGISDDWGDSQKSEKDLERTKKFTDAAERAFNKQYPRQKGNLEHSREDAMGYPSPFAAYQDPYGTYEFLDDDPQGAEWIQRKKYHGSKASKALSDVMNYANGKTKYVKGKGWQLTESQLREMIAESVKNVLKENRLSDLIGQDINNVISKQNDIVFRLESLLQSAISEAFQCGKMGNESYTECYNKKREELLSILKEFNLGNDISAYAK